MSKMQAKIGEDMDEIKIEYRGETITYREDINRWTWQGARGDGHISLAAARQSIDKALGGEKGKPKFKRREALYSDGYWDTFKLVEVTSQDNDYYWVKIGKERKKLHRMSLFADSPENQEKISQIQALIDEANQLHQKARAIRASMQRFTEWLNEQEKQGDSK
jgi:hypothetical protein